MGASCVLSKIDICDTFEDREIVTFSQNFFEEVRVTINQKTKNGILLTETGYNFECKDLYSGDDEMYGKDYLRANIEIFDRLSMNDKILSGMPSVKGTRIPISLIIASIRDEMSIDEIIKIYDLTHEDMEETFNYIIELLDYPFID